MEQPQLDEDRLDMDVFLVDVFHDEAMFDLGPAGDHAEVVRGVVEHRLGPILGPGGRAPSDSSMRDRSANNLCFPIPAILDCSPSPS